MIHPVCKLQGNLRVCALSGRKNRKLGRAYCDQGGGINYLSIRFVGTRHSQRNYDRVSYVVQNKTF